ncbi:MAG: FKBP-type peptidyl-prolyl cis-trans isomerase [Mucilaginibacter sp.]|uniref:FKBP-type peptidyl-prolyl cis-trans isomerase n=1 Tax=Mucilaginibacter sp. TaxID=1882438 RepID=UPI0032633A5D
MKKYTFLLIIIAFLSACGKKETPFDPAAQAATDDAAIQAYIKTNNIPVTKNASGLYYQIITQGTGVNPTASSTVSANYTGKLLNGSIFDQTTASTGSRSFPLNQVIQGWTIGIPLVKVGGRILLIIPSGLGYGNSDKGSIPANSVLVFTIDVLSSN